MKPIYTRNRVIGLLGGSFNPAHGGHLHITRYALDRLHLDQVWWLVSPHNPLKAKDSLADYDVRLQSARHVATDRRIIVSDLEMRAHTHYTYETIELLQKRYPGTQFVWLMGADNLASFHRWQQWDQLLLRLPVVVFDRAPYSYTSLHSKAALRFRKFLLKSNKMIKNMPLPALLFVHLRRDPRSSTQLRKTLGKKAFLGHNH